MEVLYWKSDDKKMRELIKENEMTELKQMKKEQRDNFK